VDLSGIALQGVPQAETQLEAAATRIASFGAASSNCVSLDTVDLSAEIVALPSAKQQGSANVQTLKTVAEISKSLLDVGVAGPWTPNNCSRNELGVVVTAGGHEWHAG